MKETKRVKKILMEQLELLHEKGDCNVSRAEVSLAIIEIAKELRKLSYLFV